MMLSLRRMVDESAWSAIMTLLAQARIEANDTASVPPLVMVKREQVIDILGHLEPFGEALQVREKSKGVPTTAPLRAAQYLKSLNPFFFFFLV